MLVSKRSQGRFYTEHNPFTHPAFLRWADNANLKRETVLEPFAGRNNLIDYLRDTNIHFKSASFDIAPAAAAVKKRDTLKKFPGGYNVCVTNPPWLAKNSATARRLRYPETPYDDLYKYALGKCLEHCGYVAALVPESFIRSGLFLDRLSVFISLTSEMFDDTRHPVGLAMFSREKSDDVEIFSGRRLAGTLKELEKHKPQNRNNRDIIFNHPCGNVGLIALDNTSHPSIRFCLPEELSGIEINHSSRAFSRILVDCPVSIAALNNFLDNFRDKTADVFLTAFRGLRKDGKYRRRLDWQTGRQIINVTH